MATEETASVTILHQPKSKTASERAKAFRARQRERSAIKASKPAPQPVEKPRTFANAEPTFAALEKVDGRVGRLCLSEIKSGHIRDAIRRGPGGKEYALPSLRCAIGEHPCPRPSACASHYSSERKISESGVDCLA